MTGSIWTLGGYGTSQVLRLGSHLVLAWLLTPQIFGLMALVKVVQQGLNMFSDMGIRPSIIQNKRGGEPEFLNTAWTIQIIRGFVLWICACILAWPFAALFAHNDPAALQLRYLLPVAGFNAVLEGFNSTVLATLNKHLYLGRLAMLELASQVVGLTVIIIWALMYPTVWAMVGGGLASAAFKMVVSHFIKSDCRVRLCWDRQCVDELFKFGKWIFLSTVLTFLALNLDKLILGKILTLAELGLYSMAYVFTMVGFIVCAQLNGQVLFPVYAKFRNDKKRMISLALRTRDLVLWIGAALCICIAIGAPLFFETLWDERYHAAGRIAQWMAVYIWTMILSLTIDSIPLALGNSQVLFVAKAWRCGGIVLAVGGYMISEIPGFILGMAVGTIIGHFYLLRHLPALRDAVLMQGVRFTLTAVAYSVPAVAVTMWIRVSGEEWLWLLTVIFLCGLPLLAAGRATWRALQK